VIDEYAMIERMCVWFNPINPPIRAFALAVSMIKVFSVSLVERGNISSARGPSFCHVASTRQFIHDIEDITDGNQK